MRRLPRRKPKQLETNQQIWLVQWCRMNRIPVMHIANEGKRSEAYGAKLKRMGLVPGMPDLFIYRACEPYHGLWIEMKSSEKSLPRPNQLLCHEQLRSEGYDVQVFWDWRVAADYINQYLNVSHGTRNAN